MARRIAHTLSIVDVLDKFSTEEKARAWFEQNRWHGTPTCTHCGNTERVSRPPSRPDAYWCPTCQKRFTVRMGTVMHDSKLPLRAWAVTIYSVLTARKGISSLQLSKELGITQKSAWFLLQRIREACQQVTGKLDQVVEIDETYIGGKSHNKHASTRPWVGQGMGGKQPVLGMRQRRGPTKTVPIARTNQDTLYPLIHEHVEPGAIICTDDHGAYRNLSRLGYTHHAVAHSVGEYARGRANTNAIESVWSVLKRSIHGTWHHVSVKHLARYLNEATFRLNEGNCQVDTIDRMTALSQGLAGKRLTYKRLIHGETS